MLDLLQA